MSIRICPVCSTYNRNPTDVCERCGFHKVEGEGLQQYVLRLERHRHEWQNPSDPAQPHDRRRDVPDAGRQHTMRKLRVLLEAQLDAGRWTEVTDTLERLTEVDTDSARRAKYNYTIGVVQRDHLGYGGAAVEAFERALDLDPTMFEAFEAIDTIYTVRQDWKQLERSYRRMLRRLTGLQEEHPEFVGLLWKNLGEIYRSRLGHPESAAAAYEMAVAFAPRDEELRQILAELHRELRVA